MSLKKRMKKAQKLAHFSVSDMAEWHGATRAAMHTWLNESTEPFENKVDQLNAELTLLEAMIVSDLGLLPVPLGIKQYERKEYIQKVKHEARGLLSAGAASRGHEVLGSAKGKR